MDRRKRTPEMKKYWVLLRAFIALLVLGLPVLLIFLLFPLQAGAQPITPTHNLNQNTTPILVKIKLASGRDTIRSCVALKTWGLQVPREGSLVGCAVFSVNTEGQAECTIYAPLPETMNDQATLIVGHEFLHCVYGRYHPE